MFHASTISEIVRSDYRTAAVFKRWEINYCCGGNLSLDEICSAKGLNKEEVEKELIGATQTICIPNAINYKEWSLDFLIYYIVNVHHAYLHKVLPELLQSFASFVPGHKKKYPYLEKVQEAFEDLAVVLKEHMEKEEQVVFPYIKQVASTWKNKEVYGSLFVQLLHKQLDDITVVEHRRIASLLERLRIETNNYRFADNACTRHQVIYLQLSELDRDIVQHKHLENNILFPKGAQMEKELLAF